MIHFIYHPVCRVSSLNIELFWRAISLFSLPVNGNIFVNKTSRETNYITHKPFCGPGVIMCVAYDLLFPPAKTFVAHWSERSPFIGLFVHWCREEAAASRKKKESYLTYCDWKVQWQGHNSWLFFWWLLLIFSRCSSKTSVERSWRRSSNPCFFTWKTCCQLTGYPAVH